MNAQAVSNLPAGVRIDAPVSAEFVQILTPEALALVAGLHRAYEPRRRQLLAERAERAKRLDEGERPHFLAQTKHVREGDWKIAPIPKALECRRVEITGPVEAKMIINAFNSGADSYMTDFEDSNTPNWTWKGDWWISSQSNAYSHVQTPNRKSCYYAGTGQPLNMALTVVTASSRHPGGVNCLLMDGTVRFIKDTVDRNAWQALATHAGGEVLSADAY